MAKERGVDIELKLSRGSRIYRPQEILAGMVVINNWASKYISHQGIRVIVDGRVNLQLRAGTIGVIESLYNSIKPLPIINKTIEVRAPGKLNPGRTEIPFHIPLNVSEDGDPDGFYETYHGSNINIQYLITTDVVRGYLHNTLSATLEFIIERHLFNTPVSPESVSFYITQDTQKHQLLPALRSGGFRVTGNICTQCSLAEPVTGEIVVETSALPIYSIDIMLLRVESIIIGEKFALQTTEIQTTQVADGDVCHSMALPIYIILPRLLTCPGLSNGFFSIEFQLQIVISFESDLSKLYGEPKLKTTKQWVASQTLPLRLIRVERNQDG
ncbi:uncharacterized protein LOC131062010 isoform X2 [Cryptomeria japonica]|uniref:uncharacterized protein LOC131062010 isoform X2 n=1 Tax=Cryptomeria japonica TaxID=3369 RepID=UPI0025AD48ED|nr:uncharacterized protein LOC131062010 isoform X2 [Cryptomeria japonica]